MPALPWTTRTTPDPEATYVVMGSKLSLRGYRSHPDASIIRTKARRMAQSTFVVWTCRGGDTPIRWDTVAQHIDPPAD